MQYSTTRRLGEITLLARRQTITTGDLATALAHVSHHGANNCQRVRAKRTPTNIGANTGQQLPTRVHSHQQRLSRSEGSIKIFQSWTFLNNPQTQIVIVIMAISRGTANRVLRIYARELPVILGCRSRNRRACCCKRGVRADMAQARKMVFERLKNYHTWALYTKLLYRMFFRNAHAKFSSEHRMLALPSVYWSTREPIVFLALSIFICLVLAI